MPYVYVPAVGERMPSEVPELSQFERLHPDESVIKSYRMRTHWPRFPWAVVVICGLLVFFLLVLPPLLPPRVRYETTFGRSGFQDPFPQTRTTRIEEKLRPQFGSAMGVLLAGGIIVGLSQLRARGHTFLYLTGRRLVIVELDHGILARTQTVLNFGLDEISGFSLYTQHGIVKFLGLFVTRRKKTFYIAITTRTCVEFALGAVTHVRSEYEPGADAVTLCAELDSLVLEAKRAARRSA